MINKGIISKSIEDAIVKCGQRLTLGKKVLSTFNTFAGGIRNRKTEKAILVEDTGELVASKNGTQKSVNVYSETVKCFEENGHKALNLDHNHPNKYKDLAPTCLSVPDMERVLDVHPDTGEFMIKSVTAEDSFNHSRMTLVRGDNFNSDKDLKAFEKAKNYLWNDVGVETLLLHFTTTQRNFEKLWGDIKDKPKVGSREYEELMMDTQIKANNMSLEDSGYYKEFGKAQELFRKANCRLSMDWVLN